MTKYPIKILKDEHNNPFVPMVSAESIHTNDGKSFEDKLAAKLEASNLKNSSSVVVVKDGDDCSFEVNFGASDNIIDNLNTTVAGQGPLDARQGNVLKNMIPEIVDNLETVDATKVLSAKQGYELNQRVVPTGGEPGQVLKRTDDGESLEWGDAADPNAIGGDGSIMKIIELTYAEYKTLESNGEIKEDTEYHITDVEGGTASYMTEEQIQSKIENNVVNNLSTASTTKALSAAQGKILNDKINEKTKVMRIAQTKGIKWTPSSTPTHMPYDTIIYDTSAGMLTSPNSGYIVIGSGVHQVRINGQFTTDHPVEDESYIFCYLYCNETQLFKKIRPTLRWDTIGINNVIIDVSEGDVIDVRISTNLSDDLLLAWSDDYESFGPGTMSYLQVEVLA